MGNKVSTLGDVNKLTYKKRGYLALLLVSLQFGIQPFLNERYLSPKSIKSSVVMVQETLRFTFCMLSLSLTKELSTEISKWDFKDSLSIAFIPAAIYNVQNIFAFYSYQNLDPLVFNLMNQTKIIWSAIFLKLILNKTPSKKELSSLFMLFIVAIMLCYETRKKEKKINTENENKTKYNKQHSKGLFAMLLATICSGFAGVLSQKALQNKQRNTFIFSSELAIYGMLFGTFRLFMEAQLDIFDGKQIKEYGALYNLFNNGNINCLIPIASNVVGGIGVGMITKYTSVIHKSYALITGIFISLLIRQYGYKRDKLSSTVYLAVPMTMISLYLNKIK
eukprot:193357_1